MVTDADREQQNKALTVARIYFQSHLNAPEAKAYLAKRELPYALCRKFEIGYAPSNWRGLVDHFRSHSVRMAAKDAGLLTTPASSERLLDFFRDRLMVPIRNPEGALVGYGGRIIGDQADMPKYLNTPETDLFQKSKLLYGMHEHLQQMQARREAILVEGYLDVIQLSGAGFDYAAAPMGTALTSDQVGLLLDHGVNRVWICLDGDKAGQAAAERSVDLLMDHYHPTLQIMLVQMPEGHDPDTLIREQGAEGFQRCMDAAVQLTDYIHMVCMKGFPEKPCLEDKALYLQRLNPYLQRASGLLQEQLIDQAHAFTGLSPDDIYAERDRRTSDGSVSQWHRLVTEAARWMVYDSNPKRIAERLCKLGITSHGSDELVSLASAIATDAPPSGLLYQFCKAHGKLSREEMDGLRQHWTPWVQSLQLEEHLNTLSTMPFDSNAKNGIRSIMAGMRP